MNIVIRSVFEYTQPIRVYKYSWNSLFRKML